MCVCMYTYIYIYTWWWTWYTYMLLIILACVVLFDCFLWWHVVLDKQFNMIYVDIYIWMMWCCLTVFSWWLMAGCWCATKWTWYTYMLLMVNLTHIHTCVCICFIHTCVCICFIHTCVCICFIHTCVVFLTVLSVVMAGCWRATRWTWYTYMLLMVNLTWFTYMCGVFDCLLFCDGR
jgi:hypothetical protein